MSSNRTSTLISPLDEAFRLLVDEITDYAIFLLTPTGEVATWNPGAERFKGYKAGEIIGQHFRKFYPEQDQLSRKPEHNLEVAAKTGPSKTRDGVLEKTARGSGLTSSSRLYTTNNTGWSASAKSRKI